jgi:ribosomal-protein-alanine N-acetyltransferase
MHTLAAGQLILEPLTVAHAEAMFEVLADTEIHRYLDHPAPPSVAYLREVYARLETRRSPDGSQVWLNWVIRLPGHPPLGYVQATVVAADTAWVAYALSCKYWGQGYGHAATRAMLEHLATEYGVKRYLATVEAENRRSIRLLERLGFHAATQLESDGHSLSETERLFVRRLVTGTESARAVPG